MSSFFFYLVNRQQHVLLGTARSSQQISLEQDIERTRSLEAAAIELPELPVTVTINPQQGQSKMLTTGYTFPAQSTAEDEDVVQVDVAFLTYHEQGEHNANARLDSITYVTQKELISHEVAKRKKKQEMGKNAYKHFKWYIKVLKDELASLGPNRKFKIVHWLISSRNVNAFMIKSEFFPAISIIIAPQKEHWYAAYPTDDGRSKYGTRNRTPGSVGELDPVPTYIRCRSDYCANNCNLCQTAQNCICYLDNKRRSNIPTIDEDLEDLV